MTPELFLQKLTDILRSKSYPDYVQQSPEDIASDVQKYARVVIEGEMVDTAVSVGQSKVGGKPDMPEDMSWPHEPGREESPLAFLCQINLAEVQEHDLAGKLPKTGMLWFFSIAEGDRAYGYEIDDATTKVVYQANPTELSSRGIPDKLAAEEDSEIEERRLLFGPAILLEEIDEGFLQQKRYDCSIEDSITDAVRSLGGRSGTVRMLGNPHYFREENQVDSGNENETVLLEVDGYSVSTLAFGEGTFIWTIHPEKLSEGKLETTALVFEPGS